MFIPCNNMLKSFSGKDSNLRTNSSSEVFSSAIIIKSTYRTIKINCMDIEVLLSSQIPQFNDIILTSSSHIISIFREGNISNRCIMTFKGSNIFLSANSVNSNQVLFCTSTDNDTIWMYTTSCKGSFDGWFCVYKCFLCNNIMYSPALITADSDNVLTERMQASLYNTRTVKSKFTLEFVRVAARRIRFVQSDSTIKRSRSNNILVWMKHDGCNWFGMTTQCSQFLTCHAVENDCGFIDTTSENQLWLVWVYVYAQNTRRTGLVCRL
mmetsp:Transcript_10847/g.11927  ORF Transcript_10847/g.11927 Transcript_10847/m.11927 type:complete len:267 (+) Transcript_10847:184-984(+)